MRWMPVERRRDTEGVEQSETPQVQRRTETTGIERVVVPPSWLADFEGVAADQIDRMAADQRLYATLSRVGFSGPYWTRFSDALAAYGLQVLKAWIAKGTVFLLCRQKGYKTERRIRLDQQGIEDLASMTVAVAITRFRDGVLRRGRWDPDRGASLRTFFIGQCLIQFPAVYRTWLRENRPMPVVDKLPDRPVTGIESDPAQTAETAVLLAAVILSESRRRALHRVLAMDAAGFSQGETAEQLGLSVSAVESLLYRHRKRVGA